MACTKEDLIEIRKLSDSYLNNNHLVNDIFEVVCSFSFNQKVIKMNQLDPSKVTLSFDKKSQDKGSVKLFHEGVPLLIQMPELQFSDVKPVSQNSCRITLTDDYAKKLADTFQSFDSQMEECIKNHYKK